MKIQILITTYNSEGTIKEVLESIKQQGEALKSISSICISDDGSKDRTLEIVGSCSKIDVPVKIISRPKNVGE